MYCLSGGTKACTSPPTPRRLHRLPVIDVVMTFIRFPWSRGRRRCRCPGRSATRRRSRCHWNAMSANSRSTDDGEGAAIVTRWPPSTRKTHGRRRTSDVVIYDNNRRRRRRRRRYRYQVSRSAWLSAFWTMVIAASEARPFCVVSLFRVDGRSLPLSPPPPPCNIYDKKRNHR